MRRYRTPEAFRQALATRLSQYAQERNIPFEVLRRRLIFQRFLARLLRVAPDHWVLTGGAALDWRLAQREDFQRTRTTVDLDLIYRATYERAHVELLAATKMDLNDYFTFVVTPGGRVLEEERASVRYHITAYIGRVPYLTFALDIGVLDPLRWAPEQLVVSAVLDDLGFGLLTVPALPIPHQLAEKVHALTRTLADGARRTRVVKDLADIVLLSVTEHPAAEDVRTALEAVFRAYATHPLPTTIPATPAEWGGHYREVAEQLGLPTDLGIADAMAGEFLNPVLERAARGRWDLARRQWVI